MKIESRNIARVFRHYTLPSVAALMVSGMYQIVDGMFIGHFLGVEGLAAINMAWPWIGVLFGVGLMVGMGGGVQCAIFQGAGERERAGEILGQGFWLLLCLGGLPGLLLIQGSAFFLALQGARGPVEAFGTEYLRVMGFSAPVVLGSIALPLWIRNLGAPRLATFCIVTGALGNIGLDYLFIAHFGWGLKGAALATVVAESLSVAMGLFFILGSYGRVRLGHRHFRLRPRLWAAILGAGFSSMVMYLYISFEILLHNTLFMKYGGAVQVAAFAVVGYVMAFYYMFAEGVAGGMQPLVSHFFGAGQARAIRRVVRLGLWVVLGSGVLLTLSLVLYPMWAVSIFVKEDPDLFDAAALGMRLHLFALFLDGFIVLAASFFQSMSMAQKATLIAVGNMLIQLPFLAFLPKTLGLYGVWLALPLSNILFSLLVLLLFMRQLEGLKKPGFLAE